MGGSTNCMCTLPPPCRVANFNYALTTLLVYRNKSEFSHQNKLCLLKLVYFKAQAKSVFLSFTYVHARTRTLSLTHILSCPSSQFYLLLSTNVKTWSWLKLDHTFDLVFQGQYSLLLLIALLLDSQVEVPYHLQSDHSGWRYE